MKNDLCGSDKFELKQFIVIQMKMTEEQKRTETTKTSGVNSLRSSSQYSRKTSWHAQNPWMKGRSTFKTGDQPTETPKNELKTGFVTQRTFGQSSTSKNFKITKKAVEPQSTQQDNQPSNELDILLARRRNMK